MNKNAIPRDERESQILTSAKRRISKFGYKVVSIDDICEDCKMSKKTFYTIFPTKEALFFTLLEREFDNDIAYIEKKIGSIKDPLKQTEELIKQSLELLTKDVFNIKFLTQTNTSTSQRLREKYHIFLEKKCMTYVSRHIDKFHKQGYFKGVTDTQVFAYAFVKLAIAFTYQRTIKFDKHKEDAGYYTQILTHIILQAMKEESTL